MANPTAKGEGGCTWWSGKRKHGINVSDEMSCSLHHDDVEMVLSIMMTMTMMTTMAVMPMIPFPILHLVMSHPLLIKVPLVMAPIVKRTTTMMRISITCLPMPPLLLVPQGVIITMLLLVFPMPSMFLIIEMLLVAVMMISWHCHLLTSPCNQMFLHQTLPHLLASITIWNIMPTWKSRGTMLGRIHHMVKQPEWSSSKNMYWVLFVAVDPFPWSPTHLNQIPSHLLMLVGSQS